MSNAKIERYDFELPSGKKASMIMNAKGKHLRQAARQAGQNPTQYDAYAAMIAVKTLIDGQAITVEDLDDFDEDDVGILMYEATGKGKEERKKKAAEAAGKDSSPSSEEPSSSPSGT